MPTQANLRLEEENIAAWNARDVERALALLADDILWNDVSSLQQNWS